MHITDLNECLSELPEISILEFFRPRSPISGVFNWAVWEKPANAPATDDAKTLAA